MTLLDSSWQAIREAVWNFIGDPEVYLYGLLPCLVLERLWAARRRDRWITPNLIYDYLTGVFDAVFLLGLNAMLLAAIASAYEQHLGFLNLGLLDSAPFAVQVVGAFLAWDFMSYAVHVARHKVPLLWRFHVIHHSQRDLNPFTTNRGHFVEDLVLLVGRTLPIGIIGGSYPAWVAFTAVDIFWGYFIHANVRTNLGWLGLVVVSPQAHRVHHSIEAQHFDRNYGERLAVWDYLFGTASLDRASYPATGVEGDLPVERSFHPWSLVKCWFGNATYPFRAASPATHSTADNNIAIPARDP